MRSSACAVGCRSASSVRNFAIALNASASLPRTLASASIADRRTTRSGDALPTANSALSFGAGLRVFWNAVPRLASSTFRVKLFSRLPRAPSVRL
jgi:hypothetical protein